MHARACLDAYGIVPVRQDPALWVPKVLTKELRTDRDQPYFGLHFQSMTVAAHNCSNFDLLGQEEVQALVVVVRINADTPGLKSCMELDRLTAWLTSRGMQTPDSIQE